MNGVGRVRNLVAVTGLLLLVLTARGTPASSAQGGPGGPPQQDLVSFEGIGTSNVVGDRFRISSLLPLPVELKVVSTRARVSSLPNAQGFTALLDAPLSELLGVFQQLVKLPFSLPELPTYCYSNFPSGPANPPESRCGVGLGSWHSPWGGQGRTVSSGSREDPSSLRSDASWSTGDIRLPPVLAAQGAESESHTFVDRRGVVATTETRLTGVRILGELGIESMHVRATATANGHAGGAGAQVAVMLEGVTFRGLPATITPDGIKLSAPVMASSGLQLTGVSGSPRTDGLSVRLLPEIKEVAADGTSARGVASVIEVTVQDASARNTNLLVLGRSEALATAVAAEPVAPPPSSVTPTPLGAPGTVSVVPRPPTSPGHDGRPVEHQLTVRAAALMAARTRWIYESTAGAILMGCLLLAAAVVRVGRRVDRSVEPWQFRADDRRER